MNGLRFSDALAGYKLSVGSPRCVESLRTEAVVFGAGTLRKPLGDERKHQIQLLRVVSSRATKKSRRGRVGVRFFAVKLYHSLNILISSETVTANA